MKSLFHPVNPHGWPNRHLLPRVRIGLATSAVVLLAASIVLVAGPASATPTAFLSGFNTVTNLASTVPPNGDVNPYGIVNVPETTGALVQGDTLVSNFNAKSNLQETGTTIVEISPTGHRTLFATLDPNDLPGPCPGGVGLTTALTVLQEGFVVVGSLPVTDAGGGTPEAGCLIVVNNEGSPVETWSGGNINGPWDLTSVEGQSSDQIFVTNVLNGTVVAGGSEVHRGTVVRIGVRFLHNVPIMTSSTVIGTGFAEQLNNAALVLGPTGVGLGSHGTLYVADTINNRIASIPSATTRTTPQSGGGMTISVGGDIVAPLGLTIAPNGDILIVNGGNGNVVETTSDGLQIDKVKIDPAGAGGDLFGLTVAPGNNGLRFVDDGDNTLKLFHHT